MLKITFVCLGNICRSPMAELIFKHLSRERGLAGLDIDSFGTSDEEEGNPIYPMIKRVLDENGIEGEHTAKQLKLSDVQAADLLLVMDSANLRDVFMLTKGAYHEKVKKLGDFTGTPHNIVDPWYTRDPQTAYNDVYSSCVALMDYVEQNFADKLSRKMP